MSDKRAMQRLARGFDGEAPEVSEFERLAENDPALTKELSALRALREGAQAVAKRETISDAQFGAFMAGIREGVAAPQPRWGGLWTYVSAAAACVLLVACTLLVLTGRPSAVKATEVESYSTDLKNATVDVYKSDNGKTATVWVNPASGDEW